MNANGFVDDCLRINKPCKFEGLAKTWSIYEKLKLENNGPSYLKDKLKNQVTAYIDMDSEINVAVASGNSFRSEAVTKLKYQKFLEKMNSNPVGVVMKENQDIKNFIKDI